MSTKERCPVTSGAAQETYLTGNVGPSLTQPADTERPVRRPADITPAQRWASAWLAGDHTEPECAVCSAGWALIGGAR